MSTILAILASIFVWTQAGLFSAIALAYHKKTRLSIKRLVISTNFGFLTFFLYLAIMMNDFVDWYKKNKDCSILDFSGRE